MLNSPEHPSASPFCRKKNMKDDIQTIISRIQENLPERSEIIVNGESYQVRKLYDYLDWKVKTKELQQHDWNFQHNEFVVGEDSCGNFFTVNNEGSIFFLDHETDLRTLLCGSLEEFGSLLQKPEDVDLPPHKVISVWVNPDFKPEFD